MKILTGLVDTYTMVNKMRYVAMHGGIDGVWAVSLILKLSIQVKQVGHCVVIIDLPSLLAFLMCNNLQSFM